MLFREGKFVHCIQFEGIDIRCLCLQMSASKSSVIGLISVRHISGIFSAPSKLPFCRGTPWYIMLDYLFLHLFYNYWLELFISNRKHHYLVNFALLYH
jgi:hypothetical protein